jgi:hypothetical protein
MADGDSGADALLTWITRCPVAARCLAGEQLQCSVIVGSQAAVPGGFHVPEPWSGHLTRTPILFVSSNPSIDPAEVYPTSSWDDGQRSDFFAGRFDQRAVPWVDDRMRPLLATSPRVHRDKGTRFWFAARARASELLERPAAAGTDFALTEVVHCKSLAEAGVADAYATCVQTWLRPVLAAAAARVIVLLGGYAKRAFGEVYGVEPGSPMTGPACIEGACRIVLQLPHPNARATKTNCYPLSDIQLAEARRYLRQRG